MWRIRLLAFFALIVLAAAFDPLTLYSREPDLATASTASPAVAAPADVPYRLTNVSYAQGTTLVGVVGQTLPGAVRVRVENADGEPVAGVPVLFEFASRPKGAEDDSVTSLAVSDAEGVAAADLRLGKQPGTYLLSARTEKVLGEIPHITANALRSGWWLFVVFGVLGGVGLFLYGMELGSGGLQKVAGNRMRDILGKLTTNRFMGVAAGTIITAIVQSSTATTVMVVGFVSVALMTLRQGLGVILGAGIGTTFTVQLIAFQISDYSLLLIGAGVILTMITKRKMYIYTGEIILGFGMIFYGMSMMGSAVTPLKTMPWFRDTILAIAGHPITGIFVSAVLATVMHSGAVVGLVVVLASEKLIDLNAAMPIIFGANIGTTVTTLIVSIGASREGKQAGLAHFLFNATGVLIFFPLLRWYVPAIQEITRWMGSDSIARQVANGHMFFNIFAMFIFLPLVGPWAWVVERIFPLRKEEAVERAIAPKYLNNDLLETPDLALTATYQEVLRVGGIVGEMLRRMVDAFGPHGERVSRELVHEHEDVETLTNELRRYFIRLAQKDIGLMQSREKHGQMSIVDDMRQIAHFAGTEVPEMANSLRESGAHFSEQGMSELREFQRFVLDVDREVEEAMRERSFDKAQAVRKRKDEGEDLERRLRDTHLARLDAGLKESVETSAYHMDLLSGMRQLGRHHFRICRNLEDFLKPPG